MTPEQRAQEVITAAFNAKELAAWGVDDPDSFESRIASAIRSAENDALERAAQMFENDPEFEFPATAAMMVRRLAHPSAKEDAQP